MRPRNKICWVNGPGESTWERRKLVRKKELKMRSSRPGLEPDELPLPYPPPRERPFRVRWGGRA